MLKDERQSTYSAVIIACQPPRRPNKPPHLTSAYRAFAVYCAPCADSWLTPPVLRARQFHFVSQADARHTAAWSNLPQPKGLVSVLHAVDTRPLFAGTMTKGACLGAGWQRQRHQEPRLLPLLRASSGLRIHNYFRRLVSQSEVISTNLRKAQRLADRSCAARCPKRLFGRLEEFFCSGHPSATARSACDRRSGGPLSQLGMTTKFQLCRQ